METRLTTVGEQKVYYLTEALVTLCVDIAPRYVSRPGGYTRIYLLGRRMSDTAEMARLEWVM